MFFLSLKIVQETSSCTRQSGLLLAVVPYLQLSSRLAMHLNQAHVMTYDMELEDLFLLPNHHTKIIHQLNSPSALNQRHWSPINTISLDALATQKAISTTVRKENKIS
jgi:hypothetical protein